MPQTATSKGLPAAFRMMKAMQAEGVEWGEDYRHGAREAVVELLRGRMDQLIDAHLERMAELGEADRRNGCYQNRNQGLATPFALTQSLLTLPLSASPLSGSPQPVGQAGLAEVAPDACYVLRNHAEACLTRRPGGDPRSEHRRPPLGLAKAANLLSSLTHLQYDRAVIGAAAASCRKRSTEPTAAGVCFGVGDLDVP